MLEAMDRVVLVAEAPGAFRERREADSSDL